MIAAAFKRNIETHMKRFYVNTFSCDKTKRYATFQRVAFQFQATNGQTVILHANDERNEITLSIGCCQDGVRE